MLHIAVEGPIGVGKTTLARGLAGRLGAQLLLERPQDNPFLEGFYADGIRYALQAQLFFLFQRVEQSRAIAQPAMFGPRWLCSDFMFDKDSLFARLTLSDDEYRLYLQVQRAVAPTLRRPDRVIWLQASTPTLLARIAARGIAMEQGITADYLDRLAAGYAEYFACHPEVPVWMVDTEAVDLVGDAAALDELAHRLGSESVND